MRRNRALGGQTDGDQIGAPARARDPEPAPHSTQEEAVLIAERLAALVESRRAHVAIPPAEAPAPPTAPPRTRTPVVADNVVGARHTGRLLGNLLVTRGFIVESELQYALDRQRATGAPIGQILVDLGLITDRDLVELLAEQLRMEVIDLTRVACERDAVVRLPKPDARRLAALPLRFVDGQMYVAVADPTDDVAITELTSMLGASLRLFLATRADIDAAVDRNYD